MRDILGAATPVSFTLLREAFISEPKQVANLQIQELPNGSGLKLLDFGHDCHVAKAALDMQDGNTGERFEQHV